MFLQPEPEPELPAALPASQPEPQQLWVVVPPDAAGGTGGASAMMDIRQMAFSHSQSHVAVLLAQLGSGGSYFVDASCSALCACTSIKSPSNSPAEILPSLSTSNDLARAAQHCQTRAHR